MKNLSILEGVCSISADRNSELTLMCDPGDREWYIGRRSDQQG